MAPGWNQERLFWRSALVAQIVVVSVVTFLALSTVLVTVGTPVALIGPWLTLLLYVGIPAWPFSAMAFQLILHGAVVWYAWRVAGQLQGGHVERDDVVRGLWLSAAALSYMAVVWWLLLRRIGDDRSPGDLVFLDRTTGRRVGRGWALVHVPSMLAMAGTAAASIGFAAVTPIAMAATLAIHWLGVLLLQRRFRRLPFHAGLPALRNDPFPASDNP